MSDLMKDIYDDSNGISLRDYFAAKAMQTLISVVHQDAARLNLNDAQSFIATKYQFLPNEAYRIADLMLKTRGVK